MIMIKKNWVDHIYKYIEIDDETLKFINHPPIQKAFFRLSGISQLGLASKIFPSATHTKLSHNLGVYFLADYLIKKANLSSEIIKPCSFKIASLIHGIGHFPFSLPTEIALQKATFFNKNVEDFVNFKIKPVADRISKNINTREKKIFLDDILINRNRINHFYRFFTSSILLENETELREVFKDSPNFNFDELLRCLCFPQHTGFKLLNHIDRLDYILRDMFHLGIIKIDLNLSFYFKNLKVSKDKNIELPSEWEVLNQLESYAIENIYNEQQIKTIEALYQKIFIKAIIDSEIAFADLLDWGDKEIEIKIKEYQEKKNHKYKILEQIDRIKNEFNSLPKYNLSVTPRKSTIKNLLLVEGRRKSIGKSLQKDIDKSMNIGTFKEAYLNSFDSTSVIEIYLVCLEIKEINYFLKEVAKYENYFKRIYKNKIAKCIWGNSFIEIDIKKYIPVAEALIQKMKRDKGLDTEQLFNKVFTQYYFMEAMSKEFQLMILSELKEGADEFISHSLITKPEKILSDKEFISLCNFQNQKDFLDFVGKFCERKVRRIKNFQGIALEYYTYLKKVCEPPKRKDQIKKWIFPSTLTDKGEIDVWSLYVFKNKKSLIELIECSSTKSETRKLEAINKLKQKRYSLERRFNSKIEIKIFFNDEELE